ncbi:MAG: TSUP family transporter [Bacteroidia bacterium]|nr:TSUP family transporter [Bacteroidia bacterium]
MSNNSNNTLFPVFLKLDELNLLVVGGGKVGLEKLRAVKKNSPGCLITLVSEKLEECEEIEGLKIRKKRFDEGDLEGQQVVIIAVGDAVEAKKIRDIAKKRNLLVNVADKPDLCDFYLGSIVQKGDLKIAISTNGKSPTMAKRVREVLEESFPEETQEVLENLSSIRENLKGDFAKKVKELNRITSGLVEEQKRERSLWNRIFRATGYSVAILLIMIAGHFIITYTPWEEMGGLATGLLGNLDQDFWLYVAGGFIAQMIDGALGMAYGVSVTTFLLSLGIPAITPAVASASMHASEIFTTGSSSLVYFRYRNINMKLFRKLVIPGALGAIAGSATISFLSKDAVAFVKPFVAAYTLLLGIYIIVRAIRLVNNKAYKIKTIQPVAGIGGFLDSVGGGGWGPIVTTSLIAGGRDLRYSIGSSHLAKFVVALVSTLSFLIFIGLDHWQIIFGLVVGGSVAAPFSIWFSTKIPTKAGLILVGSVVIIVSLRIIILSLI